MPNKRINALTAKLCLAILDQDSQIEIEKIINDPSFDCNSKTESGYSPLYFAVLMGNKKLVELLLAKGAEVTDTYDGISLRELAQQKMAVSRKIFGVFGVNGLSVYKEIDDLLVNLKKDIAYDKDMLEKYAAYIQQNQSYGSQAWISRHMKEAGYAHLANGYCYGVSHMGVQALLLDGRDDQGNLVGLQEFYNRIEHMKNAPLAVVTDIERAKYKFLLLREVAKINLLNDKYPEMNEQLSKEKLTAEEQQKIADEINGKLSRSEKINLEIPIFLENVELYQQAHLHKELFEKEQQRGFQEASIALPLLSSVLLDKQGKMMVADKFSGVYNGDELVNLLTEVAKLATSNGYLSPVVIELSANKHSIAIGYDPIKNEWWLIDANLPDLTTPYKDVTLISSRIRQSLRIEKADELLLLRANMFCTGSQAKDLKNKIIDPLRRSSVWDSAHELSPEKIKFKDKAGYNLKTTAIYNGDVSTLQQINSYGNYVARNKWAILITSIVLTVVVIGASIASLGMVPAIIGAALVTNALIAAGVIAALKHYDNHRVNKLTTSQHKMKTEPFANAFAEYKDRGCSTSRLKEAFISSNQKRIPSQQAHAVTVNDPITFNQQNEVASAIDPILAQQYDSNDRDNGSKYLIAFLQLDQLDHEKAINILLQYQDVNDICNMISSWNNIIDDIKHNRGPHDLNTALDQIKLLNAIKIVMQPFTTINKLENSDGYANFIKIYMELSPEAIMLLLQRFQKVPDIKALRNYLLNEDELKNNEHIMLLDVVLQEKREEQDHSIANDQQNRKLSATKL